LFTQSPDAVGQAVATWQPLRERVLDLLRFENVLAGHADEAFAAALLVLWLGAALVPGRTREARWWRLPLLGACLGAACLSLPETVGAAGSLPLRTLPLLAFVVLSAPALAPRRATSALLAAAVALQIIYGAKLSAVHRAFDPGAGGGGSRLLAGARSGGAAAGALRRQGAGGAVDLVRGACALTSGHGRAARRERNGRSAAGHRRRPAERLVHPEVPRGDERDGDGVREVAVDAVHVGLQREPRHDPRWHLRAHKDE